MSKRPTRLLYFAWLRERMGTGEEELVLPESVATVADLLDFLASRDEAADAALADRAIIRVALNKKVVPADAPIGEATEIALFPPMTGG